MSRGYTIVEVVLVLASLAIAGAVALPAARTAWIGGEAEEIVAAIRSVESAVRESRARSGGSPGGAPPGEVPPELVSHLPEGFAFDRPGFRMAWTHWTFGRELGRLVEGDGVGTLVVEIPDPEVQEAFLRLASPSLWFRAGASFAFLLPDS